MIIYHHLGLGDHFICYGLVKNYAESKEVFLFCKRTNYATVREIYNGTGIYLLPIECDKDARDFINHSRQDKMIIGFNSACETEQCFGNEFYRQAGLPYDTRWIYKINFPPPSVNSTSKPPPDNFIHDSDQFKINLDGFRPTENRTSILHYAHEITEAKEVHCIESSFKQMTEFLEPKGKLFLHYRKEKSWRVVPSRHKWNIVYD